MVMEGAIANAVFREQARQGEYHNYRLQEERRKARELSEGFLEGYLAAHKEQGFPRVRKVLSALNIFKFYKEDPKIVAYREELESR